MKKKLTELVILISTGVSFYRDDSFKLILSAPNALDVAESMINVHTHTYLKLEKKNKNLCN